MVTNGIDILPRLQSWDSHAPVALAWDGLRFMNESFLLGDLTHLGTAFIGCANQPLSLSTALFQRGFGSSVSADCTRRLGKGWPSILDPREAISRTCRVESIDTRRRTAIKLNLLTSKTSIHPTTKDRGLSRLNRVSPPRPWRF